MLSRAARLRPAPTSCRSAPSSPSWALFDAEPELAGRRAGELEALAAWCRRATARGAGPPTLHGPVPEDEDGATRGRARRPLVPGAVGGARLRRDRDVRERGVGPGGVVGDRRSPRRSGTGSTARASTAPTAGTATCSLALAAATWADAAVEDTMLWMIALGDPPGRPGRRAALRLRARRPRRAVDRLRGRPHRVGEACGRSPRRASRGTRRRPRPGASSSCAASRPSSPAGEASEGRILPGQIVPTNVAVPEADYRADVRILSLAGWRRYEGPRSLVEPMRRTSSSRRPGTTRRCARGSTPLWIGEAAVEGLGLEEATPLPRRRSPWTWASPPDDARRSRAFRARLDRAYRGRSRSTARSRATTAGARQPEGDAGGPPAAGRPDAAPPRARAPRRDRALPPLPPHLLRRRAGRGARGARPPARPALREAGRAARRASSSCRRLQAALDSAPRTGGPSASSSSRTPRRCARPRSRRRRARRGPSCSPTSRAARGHRYAVREPHGAGRDRPAATACSPSRACSRAAPRGTW